MHFRSFSFALLLVCLFSVQAMAQTHSGTITMTLKPAVASGSKEVKLWAPYPLSNAAQAISNMKVETNGANPAVYQDPESNAHFLYVGWEKVTEQPVLTLSYHVDLRSRKVGKLTDTGAPIPEPIRATYLASSPEVPVAAFKEQAAEITAGKTSILEKARAVYDWTVDNTVRDPEVKGCGLANPGRTLTECNGGGKCADISAVFVTIARAAGVPARDVYGLRLGSPTNGDITSGFHCWAEFYLPGTGWVPVDPADVRKMMLVHDLKLGDKAAEDWREFFWGGDDLFRITMNKDSRGVTLTPRQKGMKINYLMYPFAQVDGRTLNYFDSKSFSYQVTFAAD